MTGLERLLRPRSVAVFGGNWATNVVEQCLKLGFNGAVWPIHPTRQDVCGIKCYRSVGELPSSPDAAFVGVNRVASLEILAELSNAGAGGAVCFASGFAESGNENEHAADLQFELVKAAGGMPFLGPNCYGFINYLDGTLLWPDQHGGRRCETGVAVVTQSSNIAINLTMQQRGLPIAYVVTVGNQAVLNQTDVAAALLDDGRVTAIGLHIEGIASLEGLVQLAGKARRLGKPVVALKAGRSETSRRLAVSHTASIAGNHQATEALFRRLGIGSVTGLQQFLETLKLLHIAGPLGGRQLGSMSCSGGEAALVADAAATRNVTFAEPVGQHAAALRQALGPLVHLSNPLDYHTWHWGNEAALTAIFRSMLQGRFDLAWLVMDFPRGDRCSDLAWEPAVAAIANAASDADLPVAVVATIPEGLPEIWADRLIALGIAPLLGIDEALIAAEVAADIGDAWRSPFYAPTTSVVRRKDAGEVLDEAESKDWLAHRGIHVPKGLVAHDADEASAAADAVGYPVVLKRLKVNHKTDDGAIALGLRCQQDLADAIRRIASPDGYLIERQITGIVTEVMVGFFQDPECGPVLTVGAGGVLAELLDDKFCMMLPTSLPQITDGLRQLKIWPLLEGYRGAKGADIDGLAGAVLTLARLAEEYSNSILELEINPMLALEQGAVAADALIRVTTGGRESWTNR